MKKKTFYIASPAENGYRLMITDANSYLDERYVKNVRPYIHKKIFKCTAPDDYEMLKASALHLIEKNRQNTTINAIMAAGNTRLMSGQKNILSV